jgi:hypothetical protein
MCSMQCVCVWYHCVTSLCITCYLCLTVLPKNEKQEAAKSRGKTTTQLPDEFNVQPCDGLRRGKKRRHVTDDTRNTKHAAQLLNMGKKP